MSTVQEGVNVITTGRTTPIPAGQATSDRSVPVVVASDQTPVPILDNLSAPSQVRDDLLGIPRVQTPLAIFDDVNLIDIDPDIWAKTDLLEVASGSWKTGDISAYDSVFVRFTPVEIDDRARTSLSLPDQLERISLHELFVRSVYV